MKRRKLTPQQEAVIMRQRFNVLFKGKLPALAIKPRPGAAEAPAQPQQKPTRSADEISNKRERIS